MLSGKYGGGAGNIDDSAPSVSTTYSGTKTQDLHNTQAVQIAGIESEVLIDATNESVYIPEDNDTGAGLSRSVIIDATGVSGGNSVASNAVIIGANDGVGSAFGTVMIGENTTAVAAGNKNASVIVGQRASANANDVSGSVVLGYQALSTAADATDSVVIGQSASQSSGTQTSLVAIGTKAGPIGAASYDKQIWLGPNMNTTLRNFDITGAISVADRDIIIGAGTDDVNDDNRPLIHASNNDLAPHWSTGHEDATLGTSSQPWAELFVSTITADYDFLAADSTSTQTGQADAANIALLFDGASGATTLGHITASTTAGHGTAFQNTSGETRKWHVMASARFRDSVVGSGHEDILASNLTRVEMWLVVDPSNTANIAQDYTGHVIQAMEAGAAVTNNCRLQLSWVISVPANDYVRVGAYADTADGGTWDVAASTVDFDTNKIVINELI